MNIPTVEDMIRSSEESRKNREDLRKLCEDLNRDFQEYKKKVKKETERWETHI